MLAENDSQIFRFAPSPNGHLHLGHAYSALLNERLARIGGGRLLIRMEDIDLGRCRPAFDAAILEDLAWLGIEWEMPVLRQSTRFSAYRAALDDLRQRELLYPCFCTRGDVAAATRDRSGWPCDPDGAPLYPGTCRGIGQTERQQRMGRQEPVAWRLDMARALATMPAPLTWYERGPRAPLRHVPAHPQSWGDAVLARKDVPASYHLAVVVDDAHQQIGEVVRGEDLFQATSLHRLLQTLLRYATPRYHHHDLIRDDTGQKLSKSRQAASMRSLRANGTVPSAIRAMFDLPT